MTAEEILDIADHAVNLVMHRKSCWWDHDRDDARQEAALNILLAERKGLDKDRGYYFGAAKLAIYLWIRLWKRPNRDTIPLVGRIAELVTAKTSISEAMLRNLESLAPLLRGQRLKRRQTTEDEIALEVAYCRLMVEGYSMHEAAAKLGRSFRNTQALRERVAPRLRMIAAGKRPVAKEWTPSEKQLANLRRTNRDPETIRRWNEAISRAKRARLAS